MDLKNICKFWSLIKTHHLLMCNIIYMMPYTGCSEMLHISLKTEKSFIAHPWRLLCVVGLEEYSAHDWRAATSGTARSSYLARVGPVVLASGYCRCLCLCVCIKSLACPHDNSSPVQAKITKFGPEKQNTLVKIPIVFGGNWPRPSRSNLTSNSKLTPFWACPNHYSPPILVRISKFGQQMHFSIRGLIDLELHPHF